MSLALCRAGVFYQSLGVMETQSGGNKGSPQPSGAPGCSRADPCVSCDPGGSSLG